ncbi:MAG: aromatic amino acid lyase [Owenweeksia sp.]|nr:aromatic amino acid lyase [Owenweeksia sp.]
MASAQHPIYGINTGFGSLYNISIEGKDIAALQENLVRSHACGTGATIDPELVRLMLLLKVRSLSYGHSGITLQVAERLLYFYNYSLLPQVYEQGSLGASGDFGSFGQASPWHCWAKGIFGMEKLTDSRRSACQTQPQALKTSK